MSAPTYTLRVSSRSKRVLDLLRQGCVLGLEDLGARPGLHPMQKKAAIEAVKTIRITTSFAREV